MKNWKLLLGIGALVSVSLSANAMFIGKTSPQNKFEKSGQKNNVETEAEAVEGEFVVKFKNVNVAAKTLNAELASVGLKVVKTVNKAQQTFVVSLTNKAALMNALGVKSLSLVNLREAVIQTASNLPVVEYIEPNFIYRIQTTEDLPQTLPDDADFMKLWGMHNVGANDSAGRAGKVDADIDAPEAWAVITGSKDVIVAVIDTGIDYNHPDLKENIWAGPDGIKGYNAINDRLDPMDDHSHGTHCAGTIGGSGNNGIGVTGVSWNVSLMGVKFLSSSGGGSLADAIKAIDWAAENGAHIMSNSWGGGGFSQALFDSIERAAAKGILFVAASGNDSGNNDARKAYPASYEIENVVSVAASNNRDLMADFSNYGRTSVHLMAPGENIYSTVLKGRYASFSGTSMATPHVSGAAALLLAKEPSLTPAQVKDRLMATSDKIKTYRMKLVAGGRLNVYNLVTNTLPPGWVDVPDSSWKLPIANVIRTANPYLDNQTQRWEIKKEGATFLKIHFAKFQTEAIYDVLTIKDGAGNVVDALSGNLGTNFWSMEVEGDTMILEWKTDMSINDWGFHIDQFSWTDYTGQDGF